MILGLTGSVGSGKSTVADMFRLAGGADVIDADAIVYQLQQPGQACLAAIATEFGADVLAMDGSLQRKKLGEIVFRDPKQLARLNAIVHPLVLDEIRRQLSRLGTSRLVILMVPLLFEVKADGLCDKVAVVTVSESERLRRLKERDGLTEEQVQARLTAQMPQEEKEKRADFLIDNSGSLEQTMVQVEAVVARLGIAGPGTDRQD